MYEFYHTMEFDCNSDYFTSYVNKEIDTYSIIGVSLVDKTKVTITTTEELSLTQQESLHDYLDSYSDYDQDVIDDDKLTKCKLWGVVKKNEFELKNMRRKDEGLMSRQQLRNIMNELHDSFVYLCMIEGSLDTLHGILNGFPEQTIGDTTYPAEAAYTFSHVWQEDIDWINSELNIFLGTL